MDFEEKMTKKGTTQECNEVHWEAEFQRNKKTYSKLDNAPMCLRQLYVIPTLEPFFNAKKIQEKQKQKCQIREKRHDFEKKNEKIVVLGYQEVWMTYLWENYPAQKKGRSDHINCMKRGKWAQYLNGAPEGRTERRSPRFRPDDRFWSNGSDTCRQAVRDRNVGP